MAENNDLERTLWATADKLRSNMDAAEYKHVVLGLIFLKYISDAFNDLYQKLNEGKGEFEGADREDPDELAFYDALADNPTAEAVLGDETLKQIAHELVKTVRKNTSIDWQIKESVQAKLRVLAKRILRKYKYPPDDPATGKYTTSVTKVLDQAELLAAYWMKRNLIIDVIAIGRLLVTPIGTYLWLDPTIQALRHQKPLLVDQYDRESSHGRTYILNIQNPGTVPASDIKIVIETTAWDVENPPVPRVTLNPPSPFHLEKQGNVTTLIIEGPLGSNEVINVHIPEIIDKSGIKYEIYSAWVCSEVGSAVHRDHTKKFFFGGAESGGRGTSGEY